MTYQNSNEKEVATSTQQQQLTYKFARALTGPTARTGLLFAGGAVLAFAQSSPFGQAASGVSTEMITIAKYVGIILCIICGFGLMAGGPGAIAKASGLFLGLIFALFASPIITWFQGL